MAKKGAEKREKGVGEVRQDFITGKWMALAPGRGKRPNDFASKRAKPTAKAKYKEDCPFCNLAKFPQEPDLLRLPDDPDEWQVHIFPNKYPALKVKNEFRSWSVGPYRTLEAVGHHEILASRWHNQTEQVVTQVELGVQLEALVMRYRQLREESAVNYIQIIKNHGELAGASLEHPHHQIFALPVLPSDVQDNLRGAKEQLEKMGQEPFGLMLEFELDDGSRIVEENKSFVALCPYASRLDFQVWIVPRQHEPYFENIDPKQREDLAEIMKSVLTRFYQGLNDPAFNYYIHSAPCDETGFVCDRSQFDSFRWHIEIVPRLGSWGGLELGTGLEVVTVAPEEAAQFLREQKANA